MVDVVQYFVVKCVNFLLLKICIRLEKWVCKDCVNFFYLCEVLIRVLENGKVVFIFSVNNCYGWYGYVEMLILFDKGDENGQENGCVDEVGEFFVKKGVDQIEKFICLVDYWYYFKVKWIIVFV